MYNCNIIYANKHIVIDYNNKKYLVDTGSQISISNNENIEIFDKNYSSFKEFSGKNLDYFSRKVDFNLDGIVGGNILSDYQFQINFLNKQFTAVDAFDHNFNLDKYGHLNLDFVAGVPVVEIYVNKELRRVYLDTGAQWSYIKKDLVENELEVDQIDDFHPSIGNFTSKLYNVIVNFDTVLGQVNTIKDIQLKMGVLPEKLTIFYKAGKTFSIIGTDIFHRMSLIFNYKKKKLFFIMQ